MMKLITGASALLLATTVHAGPGFEVARSTAISCPASNGTVYEATSGKFEILCGIDYDSKNTAMSLTSTFEDCVEACDATSGCVDVSYVYSAQACYLKSDSGSPYANADIWSARSTDSSLTLPASVDAEALDKRATSKAAALTCENSVSDGTAYTSSNGTVFQIACSTDYSGGDLFEQDTTSFSACIDLCSVTSGCVDITYIGTSCYLKSILTAPIMNSTVWGARSNISAVSSPAASATSSSKSSTATGVVGPYSQCGGSGWTGATACVSGYSCWSQNAYYYQCTYGVTSTTSSSTSSSVPAKTTSSSTSTTPTSTSSSTKTSSTSSSSAKAVATAGAYGQCGGTGWTGATACPAGYSCTYQNPYYYQCIA